MNYEKLKELELKEFKKADKILSTWESSESSASILQHNHRIKEYITMRIYFGKEPQLNFFELELEIEDRNTIGYKRIKLHWMYEGTWFTSICDKEMSIRLIKCFDKFIIKNYMMNR